jgi:hypothetical protein
MDKLSFPLYPIQNEGSMYKSFEISQQEVVKLALLEGSTKICQLHSDFG